MSSNETKSLDKFQAVKRHEKKKKKKRRKEEKIIAKMKKKQKPRELMTQKCDVWSSVVEVGRQKTKTSNIMEMSVDLAGKLNINEQMKSISFEWVEHKYDLSAPTWCGKNGYQSSRWK